MVKIFPFSSHNGNCLGKIIIENDLIVLEGKCGITGAKEVKYAAANYSKNNIPFPNETIAYEGSTNIGSVPIVLDTFKITLYRPNSYYKDNGSKFVSPHVHFTINNEYFHIPLPIKNNMPKYNRAYNR